MAAQHNIAITQLAQVGLAEKVAQELQSHPEVLGQAARQTTPELLRLQQAAVPTTENSKKNPAIKTSDRQRKDPRRSKKKNHTLTAPQEEGNSQSSATPPGAWTGYILNVKV